MKPLAPHQKLQLLYRVEPGCLGPDGAAYIEAFCRYAQQSITPPYYADYEFVPRYDKTLPEISYKVGRKLLNLDQASAYLGSFDVKRGDFETQLDEELAERIEKFSGRL